MREMLFDNLEHLLCILILAARLGDIVTTYLVTPRLKLEMNPIVRRLGWKFAFSSLALCLVPYYSVDISLIILVPSLLVSAANAGQVWFARSIGEQRQKQLLLEAASNSRMWHGIAGVAASSGFVALTGALLVFFYPYSDEWAFWFGLGICAYALTIALHGSLWVRKLFKDAEVAAPVRP